MFKTGNLIVGYGEFGSDLAVSNLFSLSRPFGTLYYSC